jgi:hypothetical protein
MPKIFSRLALFVFVGSISISCSHSPQSVRTERNPAEASFCQSNPPKTINQLEISSEDLETELNILKSANHPPKFDPSRSIQMISLAMEFKTFSELLIDDNGDFYLFRRLGGPYNPGSKGTYQKLEGHTCYSTNPYITTIWDGGGAETIDPAKAHIVVSRLKFSENHFFYPTFGRPEVTPSSCTPFATSTDSTNHQMYCYMTSQSPLRDVAFYDEFDVPFKDEHVIADIPETLYREVLVDVSQATDIKHGGKPFSVTDLVARLLGNPCATTFTSGT